MAGLASCQAAPHEHPKSVSEDWSDLACRASPIGDGAVRWLNAPLAADQKDLNRWCATVGPPVAITRPQTSTPVLDSLCVVTWNVEIGGGDLLDLVADMRSGILTKGRPITDFVLLLQEVHRVGQDVPAVVPRGGKVPRRKYYEPESGLRIDVIEAAKRLGLSLFYVPSMRNGEPQEDRGNAVLSTMRLDSLTAIELPFEVHRRVAVAATVNGTTTGGRPWSLRVGSMHLDHRSRLIRVFNSAGVGRMRQARAVAAALSESPTVVAGDLNTWALTYTESVVDFLQESFGQPPKFVEKNTLAAKWRPDRRVDYMFFRLDDPCRGRYDVLDFRYGSDHWPLLGWVQLTCTSN